MLEMAGGVPDILEFVDNMTIEEFRTLTNKKTPVLSVKVASEDEASS